jgi:hypothetical protein
VLFARVSESGLPSFDSLRTLPTILTACALVLMFALKWSLGRTLAVCVTLGAATSLLPI